MSGRRSIFTVRTRQFEVQRVLEVVAGGRIVGLEVVEVKRQTRRVHLKEL